MTDPSTLPSKDVTTLHPSVTVEVPSHPGKTGHVFPVDNTSLASTAVGDTVTMTSRNADEAAAANKKRKLSPATKDAKQQEKETKERQRLEEKVKKDEEKQMRADEKKKRDAEREEEKRLREEEKKKRDAEREEEKRLKEEEKKKREAEREEKRKAKEEEKATKEAAKEDEKRRKEEEKQKKERVCVSLQLCLVFTVWCLYLLCYHRPNRSSTPSLLNPSYPPRPPRVRPCPPNLNHRLILFRAPPNLHSQTTVKNFLSFLFDHILRSRLHTDSNVTCKPSSTSVRY